MKIEESPMKPFYEMKEKKNKQRDRGPTHTVMETPIWMNCFHTFWVILGSIDVDCLLPQVM